MTIKTFFMALVLVLLAAVVTAALVIFGGAWVNGGATSSGAKSVFSLLGSEKKTDPQFVEIKNMVITLKNDNGRERYLLLELTLDAEDKEQMKRVENYIPVIRSVTVDALSAMTYSEVRHQSVAELRALLMQNYQAAFARNNIKPPFEKVLISKMVFQ
ncbi:Flagellar protein FliL [Paramixta manurensis]|uniref:Flagellar protein FliL n=1 Tax=Paramixta manurensis TaxID=2740817 RepID=A0A6M8U7Q5_9GAMM|nr:Flagellar protein FliL [Erwiniaceae bacterium PD-1]